MVLVCLPSRFFFILFFFFPKNEKSTTDTLRGSVWKMEAPGNGLLPEINAHNVAKVFVNQTFI